MSTGHEACYPDHAVQITTTVERNEQIACDTYRLRFNAPEIASRILPGQFIMLRLAGCDDPLLGRPLALYNVARDDDGRPRAIDVVYLVMGKLTRRLAICQPGQPLQVWGPLGNGFTPHATSHLVMVAGGIGQTPFLALAAEHLGHHRFGDPPRLGAQAKRVTLCYGARREDLFAGVDDFRKLGVDVRLSTDDGSAGHHGLVTEVLSEILAHQQEDVRVVSCGPEPMLEAVAEVAEKFQVPCEVSLETPMACGMGICFSCVAKVRDADGQWDYRRTCIEGPVFDAQSIVF